MRHYSSWKTFVVFILGGFVGVAAFLLWQTVQSFNFVRHEADTNLDAIVESIRDGLSDSSSFLQRNDEYRRFEEIYDLLTLQYYSGDLVDSGAMMQGALKAYTDALGDPYTVYLDNAENESLKEALQGTEDFEGIGAYISKKDQGVLIDEVIKDSPAFRAGLMPLDLIIKVGDEPTQNMTIGDAVQRIRGPQGSEVTLTVLRTHKDGTQELLEAKVTRDVVKILSVKHDFATGANGEKLGYVAIMSVGEETSTLFRQALEELQERGMEGLILDMRGNGGGLLDVSVLIASHFIPEGELVVSAKHRAYPDEDFYSEGYGTIEELPLVVLVDGMTASAGEIIALALRDQVGATIVGTQSFGKGSIQTIRDFADQSSLKFTIGKWYSPTGVNVSGTGLVPDVVVEFDSEAYLEDRSDNQLDKAKEELISQL